MSVRHQGWGAAIVSGLLWGVAVALGDTLATQPVLDLQVSQWAGFMASVLWQWSLTGLAWSFGCILLVRGRWALARAFLLVPISMAVVIAAQWISPSPMGRGGGDIDNPMTGIVPITDLGAYLLWIDLFYGGLYVLGYVAARRASRARARLVAFRLARSEADLLLREARVNAFKGQLQPSMLLAALAALRELYARDPVTGDQLFDRLIAFLRAAMPSVRSGFSMLPTEIDTVRSYAALREAMGMPGAAWRIVAPNEVPAVPFPALILLPVIDEASAQLPPGGLLLLTVEAQRGDVVLRLTADQPARLPEPIERRLRGGLSLTFGSAATVSPGAGLPLEIRLRPQPVNDRSLAYPNQIQIGDSDAARPRDGDRGRPPLVTPGGD